MLVGLFQRTPKLPIAGGLWAWPWPHRTIFAQAGLPELRRAYSNSGRDENMSQYSGLTHLGKTVETPSNPSDASLDRVPNPHPGTSYVARFVCPEFTTLCPVTGQPDFAHLVIDYIPAQWLVESKSLKLYLTSYRNHSDFHEATSVTIGKRITHLLEPTWLRIGAYWYPRGGIPIDVFYATGDPPKGIWIPDQGCSSYRGRG